jgi:hypothetical protein
MDFQDLAGHLEHYGCTLDHIEENRYSVRNCISGHICEVENLDEYSNVTLCHYFYELTVPATPGLTESLDKYRNFRENIINIPLEEN